MEADATDRCVRFRLDLYRMGRMRQTVKRLYYMV